MKKVFLILTFAILLISCASAMGYAEDDVVKTASVEHGCPVEKIKVIDKIEKMGNATYNLEICGKQIVYKRIGSVIMQADKVEKMINQ